MMLVGEVLDFSFASVLSQLLLSPTAVAVEEETAAEAKSTCVGMAP